MPFALLSLRTLRLAPLAVAGGLIAWAAVSVGGAGGGALVAGSAACAAALAIRLRATVVTDRAVTERVALGALLAVPGLLTAYLGLASGGFFPETVALSALAVGLLLVARCSLARDPFRALGVRAVVPAVALAALAIWVIASSLWSGAPGRALLELDRVLLYAGGFLLFASLGSSARRLQFALRVLAVAFVGVSALALLSRVAPDVFVTADLYNHERLGYPLTYWNSLGLFAGVGLVLCTHLASSTSEPGAVRVAAAGALPLLGPTLLLTYSRGAIGATVVGLVAYAILGRPRGLIGALLASALPTAVAVKAAYDATLLSGDAPESPAAIVQGHELATTVVACVILAMVVRAIALLADARLDRIRLPDRARRPVMATTWLAVASVALAAALALDAPSAAGERWRDFVENPNVGRIAETRDRLGSASSQGRIKHWRAAVEGFQADGLKGSGAGTYSQLWYQHREGAFSVRDGHSLYAETIGELGLVGLVLVVAVVLGVLGAMLPVRRGRDRALYAALFAAGLAWAVRAGIDWDWEMPAVTLWFFLLGGLAAGRGVAVARVGRPRLRRALAGGVGVLALGACVLPGLVLASQVRLDDAVRALAVGEHPTAIERARQASGFLGARAEPWEVRGIALARAGRYREAGGALAQALERDPDNWRLHAWAAAVAAASGGDARLHARRVDELNPLGAGGMKRLVGPRSRDAGATYVETHNYSGR